MARDRPYIEVYVNGVPVNSAFYARLNSASIVDATGQDSDNIELTFDDAGNEIAIPEEGASILVNFGFKGVGSFVIGTYIVEQVRQSGGQDGEFLYLTGRSADMRGDLKEPLSEHFDEDTLGGIIQTLAKRHGLDAVVSESLASKQIKYVSRLDQSVVDFGTQLADRYGALFSVKGGKLIFVKRGEGRMPAITIDRSQCDSWDIETNPRLRYGKVKTKWFDRDTGETMFETASTGLEGPVKTIRHVFTSQDDALTAAEAEGERLNRGTSAGTITLAGMPEVAAEVDIQLTGFRPTINGKWRAGAVRHQYDDTFMTTIELEAPEDGKRQ